MADLIISQTPNISSVDRETANRLNPLIGAGMIEDTLDGCARVIDDLGYLLSAIAHPEKGAEPSFGDLFLVCNVVSAALKYESSLAQSATR